jgi:predicted Zn finger-like uncharacterized protein
VVVVCESCSTRFRIDDARIPAKGRLVRCSQCKATFIAKPENASFEDTVQEVVAEVTDSGGAPVPEATADLFDPGGEDLGATVKRPAGASDEERWEFDEEPRKPAPERGGLEEHFGKPNQVVGAASPLDDIGDPTEWDLLRGSVEPSAREAHFVEPEITPREPEVETAPEPFLRPLAPEAMPSKPRRATRAAGVGRSLAQLARLGLTAAAWLVLAAVGFAGLAPLLAPDGAHYAVQPAPRTLGLADGEVRGVHGRFVENAFTRSLFVIRGELARPNPDPRLGLRAHFVDANGARIGEGAWAGASRPMQDLRELTPDALANELDASAARAALGGPFVAVFEAVPAEAASFGLALEPLPAPPPPVQEAAEATASSPPSPHPSSE